jgi:adenylate cyclase
MALHSPEYTLTGNPRSKIIIIITILFLLTFLPSIYLIKVIIPDAENAQLDALGKVIAQQLANSSTEQVVHKDALGLSVILRQLVNDDSVTHAAIYAANNEILAEAGTLPEAQTADYRNYSSNIMVQESLAGVVHITLHTHDIPLMGIYSLSQIVWVMVAWGLLILLITAVWVIKLLHPAAAVGAATDEFAVTTLQRILHTLNPGEQHPSGALTTDADHSNWHIVRSAVLVLEFSNLSMLLQRLNNKTMAKLVDECYANMETSAKLYNANVSGWLGKHVVICFNGANDETEHYFHAICCAELIIGLTNHLNEQLAKTNLPRIKLRAALHAGDLLTDTDHLLADAPKHIISEIVSIATEICQNAEHNQLLISDDLYMADSIAHRLIISDPHVVVLECINRPITTYAILDLQPTYRELLSRQIQQLIKLKSH